jgi:hypothetical protein
MSAGPRIVFTRFHTSESPKLVPWVAHTQRVLGTATAPEVAAVRTAGSVVWQLVSANNRQLARGADVHETFQGAHADAVDVVERAAELTVKLVSEDARGVLGWYAGIAGVPVVMGARWYTNQRDRRQAIELALRCIAVAEVQVGARLSDPRLLVSDGVGDY